MKIQNIVFILCFFGITKAIAIQPVNDTQIFKTSSSNIHQLLKSSKPLNAAELKKLLINNTILGHTSHSSSIYELFFKANGTVIFRKSRDKNQTYFGKWWVKDNDIFSQWKSYDKKPSINHMQYYHVIDNIYVIYNINEACGNKNQFCRAFMVLKGDPFHLNDDKSRK